MAASHLWQISVRTSVEAEEAIAALFERLFARSPSIYIDAETQATDVSIFCPQRPKRAAQLRSGLEQIQAFGLNISPGKIITRKVRREDWAESWKKHFKPLEISHALLVKPSWSRRRPRAGQAVVVLDPGLSFGTGQHPTTAFCLEQLVAHRQAGQPQSFLDIGTGSGILAIAAAKSGYSPIQAFDFDPAAIRTARANATLNNVLKHVRIFRRDLTRLPLRSVMKFDVICANLIDDLLIAQSKRIMNRLQPDGTLVVAGILQVQFDRIRLAFADAGLRLVATRVKREWQSGAFAAKR